MIQLTGAVEINIPGNLESLDLDAIRRPLTVAQLAALDAVGEFAATLGYALEYVTAGDLAQAACDFAGAWQLAIDAGLRAEVA